MRGSQPSLLATVGLLAFLARPESALAAKWTVATIFIGEYEDIEKRMRTTGSSDDVNVVVLHYKSETSAVAYRLLKDTNASHPPGQCCPNGEATCCGIEEIPLSSIGINSTVSASAVKKFYQYIVQKYPADHYLMGLRGEPDDTRVLTGAFSEGITIVELGDALKTVVDARGGKKIEVLVVGFCTSGALDWAYGVSKYVDYYVGSPQFTNSPVAVRWRVYRWAREVIEKPDISSRQLASNVVELFALTTTDCIENSNGCSNAPDEPWTCVAIESAKLPAVAAAVKDAVCAVLPAATSSLHKSVLAATTLYCSTNTPRYDMASYFMNLKSKVTDPAAKAAIDRVLAAHDASIVSWKYEPGYYGDKAYGYSFYTSKNLGAVSEIGTWQIDSLWQAYIGKVSGSASALPAATGLAIDPPEIQEGVGEQVSLTARGVSSKFPSMCALSPVTWSTDSLNGVATLDSTSANPVVLTGQQPGTGTLKASASGFSANATVRISGQVVDGDAGLEQDAGEPAHRDAGADAGADAGRDAGRDAGPQPGSPDSGSSPPHADAGATNGGGMVVGGCGVTGAGPAVLVSPLLWALSKRRRSASGGRRRANAQREGADDELART